MFLTLLGTATDYVLTESGYDHPPHCLLSTDVSRFHYSEGIPRMHRILLAKCLYTALERTAEISPQGVHIRLYNVRRMSPACLILTNASLKCKKFQNISLFIFRRQKSISYRFFTASINLFPYFSYLCLPTPVTFSISSSFPGFRMHIWIRVLSEKTI